MSSSSTVVSPQVLETISCYPENMEAKELKRILTQPHFMVSREVKSRSVQTCHSNKTTTVSGLVTDEPSPYICIYVFSRHLRVDLTKNVQVIFYTKISRIFHCILY